MIMSETTLIKILLVEDNLGDVRLTQEALRENIVPNVLSVATDGAQAINLLHDEMELGERSLPDLIVLDLNLPKKHGLDVLKEIKEHLKLRHIPVIILTTSNNQADISQAYALHANCYILKPVQLDDFFDVMRRIELFWLNTVRLPQVQS